MYTVPVAGGEKESSNAESKRVWEEGRERKGEGTGIETEEAGGVSAVSGEVTGHAPGSPDLKSSGEASVCFNWDQGSKKYGRRHEFEKEH